MEVEQHIRVVGARMRTKLGDVIGEIDANDDDLAGWFELNG